jgi:MFS family permease
VLRYRDLRGARSGGLTALYVAKALRLFAYGSASIALPVYLISLHIGPLWIGTILAVALCMGAAQMLLTNRLTHRFGGTAVGVVASLTMALGGLLAASGDVLSIVIAAALGLLNASAQEIGPFLPLEQVSLATRERGVDRIALYNVVGTAALAFGAVVGGALPFTPIFLLYAVCGACVAACYARADLNTSATPEAVRFAKRAFGISERLAALFAVDAFGGGLIVQGFVAYWFLSRFHTQAQTIGFILGLANILSAFSLFAAAWLGKRFGLLNTMVFTHLPSNILLALIPLAPTLPIAAAMLLARYALSQMDVPTRQAFVVAIVPEHDRIHAAGITSAVRPIAAAASPLLSSIAMQTAAVGVPFFAAGGIKICYDLTVYFAFRAYARASHAPENSRIARQTGARSHDR